MRQNRLPSVAMLARRGYTVAPLLVAILSPVQAASLPIGYPQNDFDRLEQPEQSHVQQIAQQPPPDLPPLPPLDITPPPPRPPRPPDQPELRPEPLPPPEDLLQPSPETPVTPPDLEIPGTITVKQFNVVGSTVFSESELAEITAPYTGRPITFAELLQARSAITQRYIDEGYITSGAFIPAGQVIQDGVITIQVIEGELETINVEGLRRLNPAYVRSRLRVAAGRPLNVNRLLQGLQLLQLNPLIETLSAELAAGTRTGQSILNVQVTQSPTFHADVILDNGRSPSVGSFRRSAVLSEANLLGQGDALSISYSNTEGSNTWDVDYTFPFNPRNGTFRVLFSSSDSEIIEPPFDVLNIEPDSRTWEFSVRQPIVQTPSEELALSLALTHRISEAFIELDDGIRIPLSEGANEEGETRLSALRFAQEWIQRDSQQVTALRSQFSLGTDWLNATNNEDGLADSEFFSWQGQAQWVRLLGPDMLFLVRANTQLADEPLLSLEQFSLGGLGSVRGYRQDQLLTDNGLFASAELRVPILRIPEWESLLQLTPFLDYGYGWNNGDRDNPDPNELISVGLGLLWQTSDRITARIDWGIPLTDAQTSDRTLQESGILFNVVFRLF